MLEPYQVTALTKTHSCKRQGYWPETYTMEKSKFFPFYSVHLMLKPTIP